MNKLSFNIIKLSLFSIWTADFASANYQKIQAVLTNLERAAFNKTSPSALSKNSEIQETLRSIKNYGCWCYLDSNYVKAKGAVQDRLDQECKQLVHGYKCLVIDGLDRGINCDPLTQDYIEFDIFRGNNDVVEDCTRMNSKYLEVDDKNKQQCAIDLCIVDGQFSMNLFGLVTSGSEFSVFDPMMSHDNYFETETECKNEQVDNHRGSVSGGRSSCGRYPNRYLFKTMGGERACCGDRTYNTVMMKCCNEDRSIIQSVDSFC